MNSLEMRLRWMERRARDLRRIEIEELALDLEWDALLGMGVMVGVVALRALMA